MSTGRIRALPPGVVIRLAGSRDVRALRTYFAELPLHDRWLRFAGAWMPGSHDLEQRLGRILIAVDVGQRKVVGELMFGGEAWPDAYEEVAISVALEYRTRHVANELFSTWQGDARSRGIRFAMAEQVHASNHVAKKVLRRLGFAELAGEPGEPFVQFRLDMEN